MEKDVIEVKDWLTHQDDPRFWELLDACLEAVELFDLNGMLLYVNAMAAYRYGKSVGELLGVNIWSLYVSEQQMAHRKTVVNKVIGSGQPVQFTDRHEDHWTEVLIYPVRSADGDTKSVATFTHDITKQIRAEERLKLAALQLLTIQEEERRRIAQDLHDDIGQSMTALILNLKAIHGEAVDGRNDVADQVKVTIRQVEDMMRHVRQVFYELRPPPFTTLPLAKVLESFCSSLVVSTGLRIVFSSQEQLPPIPVAQATAFYRLVQEGMNNVVKHSRATSVWINLEYLNSEVNISLEDDGQGFDQTHVPTYGMGLQGLRERFFMLSGSFDVESAVGKGTRLYGSLPVVKPDLT